MVISECKHRPLQIAIKVQVRRWTQLNSLATRAMKHLLAVIASHLLAALAASAPDKFINIAYNQTVDTGPLNTSPGVHEYVHLNSYLP